MVCFGFLIVTTLLICNLNRLETKAQVLAFMNEVYSIEPVSDDMYTLKIILLSDIFSSLLQFSTYFRFN